MSEIVQLKSPKKNQATIKHDTQATQPSPQNLQSYAARLDSIRKQLAAKKGRDYWRSLEELADTKEFQELMHREFPDNASEWNDPTGRRKFLKLMGASLALAGFTACTKQPTEYIAPYVQQPEAVVLGKALYFATATTLNGYAMGVLAESHEGRPTKIEGNPDHPASLGATDIFSQASILGLYDPDRSQTLTHLGDVATWPDFVAAARASLKAPASQAAPGGQPQSTAGGLRILTENITSPTLAYQIQLLINSVPNSKWHRYEPAGSDNAIEGARLAFGRAANAIYDFSKADVVVSLDADFLSCGPASVAYARQFADRRRLEEGKTTMSRLYVIESTVTSTGAVADNRLPVKPSEVESFARALAANFGVGVQPSPINDAHRRWVDAIAKDLKAHGGASIVIAGDAQPPIVHAIAHAINEKLGNVGKTVRFTNPIEAGFGGEAGVSSQLQAHTIQELVNDINAGLVDTLVILGGNPVYNAPADLNFIEALKKVRLRVHLSHYQDETSELCHWHIPEAHYLESWSDARAYDGTISIIQPLIAPIYSGKTAHEVLAAFTDQPSQTSYQIVQGYWRKYFDGGFKEPAPPSTAQSSSQAATGQSQASASQTSGAAPASQTNTSRTSTASQSGSAPTTSPPQQKAPVDTTAKGYEGDFNKFWRKALHDGFITKPSDNSRAGTEQSSASFAVGQGLASVASAQASEGLEIVFRPDPTIHDGRFANNGWLQEAPKPITTLVWDNAAIMSPATAARLGLGTTSNGIATNKLGYIGGEFVVDQVDLTLDGRTVRAPVWIQPGHPDDTVTVYLGHGRTRAGRVGTGQGFNAYAIRPSTAQWFAGGLQIAKAPGSYSIVATQLHHLINAEEVGVRDIIRSSTFEEYLRNPGGEETNAGAAHEAEAKPTGKTKALVSEQHPSLYPEDDYSQGYRWGMTIDLNACIGCHACIVACQSENNIPVIGKEQMARRRGMHWLRVDAYFKGNPTNPETYFQPVPCQQCEKAPCEVVCPVAATVHSAEGLNDMVYNRCVGTRYCSNNCPYKVRRFNFLLYQDFYTASLKMLRNPEVSVRSRGVMEKCTYCVQRIQEAKIEAEKQNRPVQDGEIVTACAAVCPTKAVVFGNINDPNSEVARLKQQPRNYSLLDLLNTQPRTTYLAAVRNPNPELQE